MPDCANHPKVAALWHCPTCKLLLCAGCIRTSLDRGATVRKCQACGNPCDSLVPEGPPERSFFLRLPGAFVYPFRGSGWVTVLVGSVLLAMLGLMIGVLATGWRDLVFGYGYLLFVILTVVLVFSSGYLCAFLIKMIRAAGAGGDEAPEWPELRGWWEDVLRPFLLAVATAAVSLAPVIAWVCLAGRLPGGRDDQNRAFLGFQALLVVSLLYLPMAVTAVALHNTVTALNPLLVIRAIIRLPLQYLVACLVLVGIAMLQIALEYAFTARPALGWVLGGLVSFYLLTVEARVLGLMYHANREKLGWF
jgi:hypothetical protein